MSWLKRVFGSSRRITVSSPLIESPQIGFFNLLGASAQAIVEEDKIALGPIFSASHESDTTPPICDVLLIYAHVEGNGRIARTVDGLRDIVRKANAVIVIMASENEPNNLIAAGKATGYGRANIVLTISRKGTAFPRFYIGLFNKMYRGITMPVAWVELAPQIPGATHGDCPDGILAAEVSHIVFK